MVGVARRVLVRTVRRRREGTLAPDGEQAARTVLQALCSAWVEVKPTDAVRTKPTASSAIAPYGRPTPCSSLRPVFGRRGCRPGRPRLCVTTRGCAKRL